MINVDGVDIEVNGVCDHTHGECDGREQKDEELAEKPVKEHENRDKAEVVLRTLTPGCYFGEISLVYDSLHLASVTAITDSVLLSIPRNAFHVLFEQNPDMLAEFQLKILGSRAELYHVLRHPVGRKFFLMHLEKEFACESALFWSAADAYKAMAKRNPRDSPTMYEKRRHIVSKFLAHDAEKAVNVAVGLRDRVVKEAMESAADPTVFDSIQTEVYKLMERDTYRRFQRGELWKQLSIEIGTYSGTDDTGLNRKSHRFRRGKLPKKGKRNTAFAALSGRFSLKTFKSRKSMSVGSRMSLQTKTNGEAQSE